MKIEYIKIFNFNAFDFGRICILDLLFEANIDGRRRLRGR